MEDFIWSAPGCSHCRNSSNSPIKSRAVFRRERIHPIDNRAGRASAEQRGQRNSSAARLDERLPIDLSAAPVLTLDQNVGLHGADNFLGTRLLEHHYIIDRFERGQDSRALPRGIDGAPVTLELSHAAIAVEADHQHGGLRARA